jgi:hypothetical protein
LFHAYPHRLSRPDHCQSRALNVSDDTS